MNKFGQKLRLLRTTQKLTLQELAHALGLSAHGYISELESGKKIPTVELVIRVATFFDVTTDRLLRDELLVPSDDQQPFPNEAQSEGVPFVSRDPTEGEVEKLRLILSAYQDGSGQQTAPGQTTLPGWRDFERVIAYMVNGMAQENKYIFDVLAPAERTSRMWIGISCKMRRTLDETLKTGRATLELSNSSGMFWKELRTLGIDQHNYREYPHETGQALIGLINKWHEATKDKVNLSHSFFLALSWNKHGDYQLFKFNLRLPDPQTIKWDFPDVETRAGLETPGRRLRGKDQQGTVFEWYGESGGQLKYYPLIETALWKSNIFQLEALPAGWASMHGLLVKTRDYFPAHWERIV